MQADRKWVERNLGFDPVEVRPPDKAFAFPKAAKTSDPEDLQREIIDFDSESQAGLQFLAFRTGRSCPISMCEGRLLVRCSPVW